MTIFLLRLESRKLELRRLSPFQSPPVTDIPGLIPSQKPNPRLNIVMELELHVIYLGDLSTGVGDLILWLLIFEADKATIISLVYV
jgi:hypothetical protein